MSIVLTEEEQAKEAQRAGKFARGGETLRVVAVRDGTYPDLGDFYQKYRAEGTEFIVKREDFAHEWMREVTADTPAPVAKREVPQTTDRRKPGRNLPQPQP